MRAPSIKRLRETFKLEHHEAVLIRALAHQVDNRDKLEHLIETHCPETYAYARSCYNDPFQGGMWRRTVALHAIDRILGTCGVEALGPIDMHAGPPFEYCNTGDTYAATLIYSRENGADNLFIGCWGTVTETHPEWERT